MIDDVRDIAAHYDADPEREDRRLVEHQLEFELTWRYLNEYLPPSGSVLEIGAATGRYTCDLARQGYAVTAVDLSPRLIDACKKRCSAEGVDALVRTVVADSRDLSPITEDAFDAVLMMGPLYHLIVEADRRLALEQAIARLRQGGIVFSAFLSRFGVLGDLLKNMPSWIDRAAEVQWLIAKGRRPDADPRGGFRGYFATIDEIVPLHEGVGFETIALAGIEPAISADDDSFNRLTGHQREQWLDLLYNISREPSIIGASRHLLYVGRKSI